MKIFVLLIFMFTANIAIGAEDPASLPETLEEKISLEEIDKKTKDGHTTLFIISMLGNSPETVQLLIDNGADINAEDDDGDTPLMGAVCYNNERSAVKIAEVLVQAGANLNIKDDSHGLTAGHCAFGKERWDILLTFLSEESFDLFVKLDAYENISLLDLMAVRLDIVDIIQDMKASTEEESISQNQANEMFKDVLIQAIQTHIQEERVNIFNKSAKNNEGGEGRI